MRLYFFLIFSSFLTIKTFAQNAQGIVMDMVNDKKYNFSYTTGSLAYDNNYLTRYIINEKSNNPLKKVLVNYDKTTEIIDVTLFRMNLKDTLVDRYTIKYNDSLGLIFTQRRTVTDFLKGTYELVLTFKDSSRTFIEIQQVMNQSTVYKKHYVFRLLTSVDISENKKFIQKLQDYKKTEPLAKNSESKNIKESTPVKINTVKPDSFSKPTQPVKPDSSPSTIDIKPQETNKSSNNQTTPFTDNALSNNISNKPITSGVLTPAPVTPSPSKPIIAPVSTGTSLQNNLPAASIFQGKIDSIDCIIIPASHDMICWQIILKGGVNNYTFQQQGIEPLLLHTILNGATKAYTTEELELKKNTLMLQTDLFCTADYSILEFTFPLSSWNEAVKLIGEMLGKPAFNAGDIEEARSDVSLGVMTQKGDSWEQLRTVATQVIYTGKGYDKTPYGEGLNLAAIQTDAIKKLYTALINRNNISIAVQGKVSATMIRNALKNNFRWLNWGGSIQSTTTSIDINASSLTIIKGDASAIATCVSNAPKPFSVDYAAFILACEILKDLINKINTQKKLIDELQINYPVSNAALLFIQFTATDADKAMQMIIDEVKRLKKTPLNPSEVTAIKQNLIAAFYMQNCDAEQWNQIVGSAAFFNNTALIEDYEYLLQKVTPSDIQQVMTKYVKAFRSFYTGDADAVNSLIFTQRLD